MAWTTPKTDWLAGDAVTAAEMNFIGDNLVYLKDPASADYTLNEGANYTTTSVTFVDVDATNLALTITTTGGDVLVHFDCFFLASGGRGYLDFAVDGVRHAGDDGLTQVNSTSEMIAFTRLVTGLSAGSHTFKLQWKVTAGTSTIYAGAGTSQLDVHPQFFVREI